jgi:hypothetical protein
MDFSFLENDNQLIARHWLAGRIATWHELCDVGNAGIPSAPGFWFF